LKRFKSDLPNVLFVSLIVSSASNWSYIDLKPLELRRLKNDVVMYFECLNNLVALPSDEYIFNKIMLFTLDLVVYIVDL